MSHTDKRLDNTTPAADIDVTDPKYVGRVFLMVRYGELTVVRLVKAKRRDIYLEYVKGDRKDGFTLTHSEFKKFYHLTQVQS